MSTRRGAPGRWMGIVAVVLSSPALAAQRAEPVVYEVAGVRVVQTVLPAHEVATANVYLLGGSRQLTPATAGIEGLILDASSWGTEGFPGESVREAQVATGGRFYVRTTADWSMIGFTGLLEEFDRSWEILVDRVVRPSLDTTALDLVRNRRLTLLRAETEDPDASVRRLAEKLAFAGHPYAIDVEGTEASLTGLSVDDLRRYHTEQFVRSRMLVSVVGSVDRGELEALIRGAFAELPVGSYVWEMPDVWAKDEGAVEVQERTLPTDYIMGYFGGPTQDDEHYPAFQVAMSYISGLISSEIRARGLSYAPGAAVIERAASGGMIYVSTTDPFATMGIINDAISAVKQGQIALPRAVIRDYAESSALEYYLSNQSTEQRADFQATSLLMRGHPQSVADWVEALRDVSNNRVRLAISDYVRNIQYAYLGRPSRVPRERMLRH